MADERHGQAWAEFCEHPSMYSYRGLMKFVSRQDRPAWHEKAIEAATARADLYSLIGLLAETKETGRLADLVGHSSDGELEQVSHHVLEPAAQMLQKAHADSAARLWRAMGMRIVNAGKSRYYQAAPRKLRAGQAVLRQGGARGRLGAGRQRRGRRASPQDRVHAARGDEPAGAQHGSQ